MKSFRCLQGRAHRALGGIRRGEARAGCTQAATQWRTGGRGDFVARGRHRTKRRAGENRCAGRLQSSSPRRSRCLARIPDRYKAAVGVTVAGGTHGTGTINAPQRSGTDPDAVQVHVGWTRTKALRIEAADGIGSSGVEQQTHGGHPVGEPPVVHGDLAPASGTVRLCTTRRSRARRAPACCQRWWSGLDELGAAEGRRTSCVSAQAGALEPCPR